MCYEEIFLKEETIEKLMVKIYIFCTKIITYPHPYDGISNSILQKKRFFSVILHP